MLTLAYRALCAMCRRCCPVLAWTLVPSRVSAVLPCWDTSVACGLRVQSILYASAAVHVPGGAMHAYFSANQVAGIDGLVKTAPSPS